MVRMFVSVFVAASVVAVLGAQDPPPGQEHRSFAAAAISCARS